MTIETETYDDVFEPICDTPAEVANMKARSDLLSALQAHIQSWGVTQAEAARRLGITRPRLTDLAGGKLGKFSLDSLVNLTAGAGLVLEFRITEIA